MRIEQWDDIKRVMRIPLTKYSGWSGYGTAITLGHLKLYLSGAKIIAFQEQGRDVVASQNIWGQSGGLHLNILLPDKNKRIPYGLFRKKLDMALKDNGIFCNLLGSDENIPINDYDHYW